MRLLVPDGYSFPTWHVGQGGAAALLEGLLLEQGGCLYVHAPAPSGDVYLIVWPDTLRLVLNESGTPIVTNGGSFGLRIGDKVSLTGGEITPSLVPTGAAACNRTHVWGVSEIPGLPR